MRCIRMRCARGMLFLVVVVLRWFGGHAVEMWR
jgi:hypothetical protein